MFSLCLECLLWILSVDPSVSGRAQDACPLGTGAGEGSEAGDSI